MKKLTAIFATLLLLFTLFACDSTLPATISGIKDLTYYIGESAPDYLNGVTATRGEADVTEDIKVDSSAVKLDVAGAYLITYSVDNEQLPPTTKSAIVKVEKSSESINLKELQPIKATLGLSIDKVVQSMNEFASMEINDIVIDANIYGDLGEDSISAVFQLDVSVGNMNMVNSEGVILATMYNGIVGNLTLSMFGGDIYYSSEWSLIMTNGATLPLTEFLLSPYVMGQLPKEAQPYLEAMSPIFENGKEKVPFDFDQDLYKLLITPIRGFLMDVNGSINNNFISLLPALLDMKDGILDIEYDGYFGDIIDGIDLPSEYDEIKQLLSMLYDLNLRLDLSNDIFNQISISAKANLGEIVLRISLDVEVGVELPVIEDKDEYEAKDELTLQEVIENIITMIDTPNPEVPVIE